MKTNKDDIISFEVMGGWPIYKMKLRDILEGLGFELKDGKLQIDENSEVLDMYPRILHDDGMGYSPTIEYVTEANIVKTENGNYCNVFAEEPMKNIELWKKGKFYQCAFVHEIASNSDVALTVDDIKEENDELYYLCRYEVGSREKYYKNSKLGKYLEIHYDKKWLKESEIEFGWINKGEEK